MLRPTFAAVTVMLATTVSLVLGLSFDDRVLLAVSVALLALLVLSLAAVLTQWALWSSSVIRSSSGVNPRYRVAVDHGDLKRRLILPRNASMVEQWVQRDHRGSFVERFRGMLPQQRGVFHLESLAITWKDPFGLWKARRHAGLRDDEVVLLPEVDDARSSADRIPDALPSGQHQGMNGVRQYEFGDSPRMIAWKYTAHLGELMTRETNQEQVADTLWVVDPADADVESCVQEVLRHMGSRGARGGAKLYSDGTGIYSETTAIMRQLAAVQMPRSADDAPAGRSPDGSLSSQRAWSILPECIENFGKGTSPHPVIIVVSTRAQDDITSLMAASYHSASYRLIRPMDSATAAVHVWASSKSPSQSAISTASATASPTAAVSPAAKAKRHRRGGIWRFAAEETQVPVRGLWRTVTGVTGLWALAAITVMTLSQLFVPQGVWWPYFAVVGFVVISLDAMLAARASQHVLLRAGLSSVATALVGFLAVLLRIHISRGYWLFIPHSEQVAVPAGSVGEDWEPVTTTLWDVLVKGFAHVYAQYPPIQINAEADALLILAVVSMLVLLRMMMTQIRLAPLVALVPVFLMSIVYQLTGQSAQTWWIAVVIFAAVLLVWVTSPSQTPPLSPMLISAMAVAVSMALLAPMMVLARSVSIPIASNAGLFSSGTINPMVDLKRGLQEGSNATVLSYRASEAVYMRLSTLDNFNGDTWSFSSSSSDDDQFSASSGSVYTAIGDGYLLRSNDSADVMWVTPLMKYMVAEDTTSTRGRYIISSSDNDHYILDSSITIDSLQTQFLPLPGEVIRSSGVVRDGNWHRNANGVFRNNLESTSSGMEYRVQSMYLKPVTRVSDFERLSDLQTTLTERKQWLADNPNASSDPNGSSDSSATLSTLDGRNVDDSGTGKRLRSRYGSLPATLPSSVRAVINQAKRQGVPTGGVDSDSQLTVMRYLVRYFKQRDFVYSLNEPDGNGRNNMEMVGDFLQSKSGYCVHYASALAVLARGMGVSTRMVLGYTPGQSSGAGTYTVAAKQLHAWVEAYIDGIGWVPFDVTPASSDGSDAVATPESTDSTSQSTASQSATPTPTTSTSSAAPTPSENSSSTDPVPSHEESSSSSRTGQYWSTILQAVGLLLGLALVILLIALPSMIRRIRRLRRYSLVDEAMNAPGDADRDEVAGESGEPDESVEKAAGEATSGTSAEAVTYPSHVWTGLWQEIVDTAIDAGAQFPTTISDTAFASYLSDLLLAQPVSGDSQREGESAETSVALLTAISRAALRECFGADSTKSDSPALGTHSSRSASGGHAHQDNSDVHPDPNSDGRLPDRQLSGRQLPKLEELERLRMDVASSVLHSRAPKLLRLFKLGMTVFPRSVFH
jgi:hypothetical protein